MVRTALPLLTLLLVGVATWWLLTGEGDGSSAGREVAREGAAQAEAPRLIGHAARTPSPPSGELDGEQGPTPHAPAAAPAAAADPGRRLSLRVVDRSGRPISRARVRLRGVDGTRETWERGYADENGDVAVALPPGTIVELRVHAPGLRRPHPILTREDPSGVDLHDLAEVVAEDLVLLVVRTVDARGEARGRQRILFRPREEDVPIATWWGHTSDAEGWCRLGPFAMGTRVEARPGTRGLAAGDVGDPEAWTPYVVDGTPVELIVQDVPLLRLAFPGAKPSDFLPIAVLDPETRRPLFPPVTHRAADGVWTSPATPPGQPLEILVGPLTDGRFARRVGILPAWDPIDVELERGVALEGRATSPEVETLGSSSVAVAFGRGFTQAVPVSEDGRFVFPGLPRESLRLMVKAHPASDGRYYAGVVTVPPESSYAEVPLLPSFRVRVTPLNVSDGAVAFSGPLVLRVEATTKRLPVPLVFESVGRRMLMELLPGPWHLAMWATTSQGDAFQGALDLGPLTADREDVFVPCRPSSR